MRVFISIDIPEEIKKQIGKIQQNLPDFDGKVTEKENLHLTLKFLGEIEDKKVEEVKKKLSEIKIKKFESSLGELGVFTPSFIKIIWITLSDCDNLQQEIDNKLEKLFKKEKRFMSHLTIARVKGVRDGKRFLRELKNLEVGKKKFKVSGFFLKKSTLTPDGPIYEDLLEVRLD